MSRISLIISDRTDKTKHKGKTREEIKIWYVLKRGLTIIIYILNSHKFIR